MCTASLTSQSSTSPTSTSSPSPFPLGHPYQTSPSHRPTLVTSNTSSLAATIPTQSFVSPQQLPHGGTSIRPNLVVHLPIIYLLIMIQLTHFSHTNTSGTSEIVILSCKVRCLRSSLITGPISSTGLATNPIHTLTWRRPCLNYTRKMRLLA